MVGLAVSACAPAGGPLRSPVTIPILRAAPSCYALATHVRVPCPAKTDPLGREVGDLITVIYWTDWAAIVRALRGACLAAGGSREDCGAD